MTVPAIGTASLKFAEARVTIFTMMPFIKPHFMPVKFSLTNSFCNHVIS